MRVHEKVPLFCFPFAGAGPSFYRAWSELNVRALEIYPVQLPGREAMLAVPPFTDLHKAADYVLQQVLPVVRDQPVALFGHCFVGAVLAYEVAQRLTAVVPDGVRHLVVSASRGPFGHRKASALELSDDAFVERIKATTGYVHEAFAVPEIRELLLPTLRADFQMDEGYAPRSERRLHTPITAMFALEDRLATAADMAEWGKVTTQSFEMVAFQGGHMYLAKDSLPVLSRISNSLVPTGG